MQFQVNALERTAGGVPQQVYLLSSVDGLTQAEVWPDIGCNCLRWQVPGPDAPLDLLYRVPDWDTTPAPNRSGIPILFPFPNRIRSGTFSWQRREFRLPLNDPARRNSIHGSVCRFPWRVLNTNSTDNLATLTAEFQTSIDAPEVLDQWPGDYKLTMRFLLRPESLSLSATMENPGEEPLPVGLGYHPYFNIPMSPIATKVQSEVTLAAESFWELRDNLPTGRTFSVEGSLDLRQPTPFDQMILDEIFTDLTAPANANKLFARGSIHQEGVGTLRLFTTAAFRELVVFTPPSRKAICLEPYTCVTDAINLQQRGLDAGLIVLNPGDSKTEFVVFRFDPAAPGSGI